MRRPSMIVSIRFTKHRLHPQTLHDRSCPCVPLRRRLARCLGVALGALEAQAVQGRSDAAACPRLAADRRRSTRCGIAPGLPGDRRGARRAAASRFLPLAGGTLVFLRPRRLYAMALGAPRWLAAVTRAIGGESPDDRRYWFALVWRVAVPAALRTTAAVSEKRLSSGDGHLGSRLQRRCGACSSAWCVAAAACRRRGPIRSVIVP